MRELPIACTLDAVSLSGREAELASVGRRSLIRIERAHPSAAALSFRRDAWTRAELERIIAAESECCPFLELSLRETDGLELAIKGPADAAPVVALLVDAFDPEAN